MCFPGKKSVSKWRRGTAIPPSMGCFLAPKTRGCDVGRFVGQSKVAQDLSDRRDLHDRGNDLEFASAVATFFYVDSEDSGQ